MGDLLFLADAPNPDTPADDGFPTSRVQVGKLGRFVHGRFGRFLWTPATFASFIKNFRERSGGRIPIDPDHAPEKGGSTEAEGWITDLEVEGDKLFAAVEWTKQAAQKIRDRRYMFISPTFSMNGKGEGGESIGPKLVGAGLTNRPFLENMAVVSLSALSDEEIIQLAQGEDPETPELAQVEEPEDARFDEALEAFFDAESVGPGERFQLRNLLKHYKGKPHPFTACVRDNTKRFGPERVKRICATLKDINEGTTKWRKGGNRKVTAAAAEALATFSDAERAGVLNLLAELEEASDSRTRMPELADIAKVFGLSEDASAEDIVTAAQEAQEKAEKAPEPGEQTITAEQYTQLQEQAARGEQAAKTLDERDRDDTFRLAMDAGKVGDASRETFNTLWESNRDGAKAFLDSIPATVPVKATGTNKQAAGETPEGVDPERYSLDQQARAYMAEHSVDYETAIFAVEAQAVTA